MSDYERGDHPRKGRGRWRTVAQEFDPKFDEHNRDISDQDRHGNNDTTSFDSEDRDRGDVDWERNRNRKW